MKHFLLLLFLPVLTFAQGVSNPGGTGTPTKIQNGAATVSVETGSVAITPASGGSVNVSNGDTYVPTRIDFTGVDRTRASVSAVNHGALLFDYNAGDWFVSKSGGGYVLLNSGTALALTGTIAESQVTSLTTDLAAKANSTNAALTSPTITSGTLLGTLAATGTFNTYLKLGSGLYFTGYSTSSALIDPSGGIPYTNGNWYNGGTWTFAGIVLNGKIRLKGYTVATLPAGTQGDYAFVTDALAPSFLVTVTGGGAAKTVVFYDGSNWIAE